MNRLSTTAAFMAAAALFFAPPTFAAPAMPPSATDQNTQQEEQFVSVQKFERFIKAVTTGNNIQDIENYLEEGRDINFQPFNEFPTALQFSIVFRHFDIAELLLQNGADPNIRPPSMMPLITLAASMPYVPDSFLQSMIEHGADIEAKDENGWTTLMALSPWSSMTHQAKLFLDAGANVKAKNNKNSTAMHAAATTGNVEATKLLLAYGGSLTDINEFGLTPLGVAEGNFKFRKEEGSLSPEMETQYQQYFTFIKAEMEKRQAPAPAMLEPS